MPRKFVHWLDPRLPQPPRLELPPLTIRGPRTCRELTYDELKALAEGRFNIIDSLSPAQRARVHIFGLNRARAYAYDLRMLVMRFPQRFLDAPLEMREQAIANTSIPKIGDL